MARDGVVPEDYPSPVAAEWPDLLDIVKRLVKPERDPQKRDALRERWWQYAEKRPGLRAALATASMVLAINTGASPHLAFAVLETGCVFANTLVVGALDGMYE